MECDKINDCEKFSGENISRGYDMTQGIVINNVLRSWTACLSDIFALALIVE